MKLHVRSPNLTAQCMTCARRTTTGAERRSQALARPMWQQREHVGCPSVGTDEPLVSTGVTATFSGRYARRRRISANVPVCSMSVPSASPTWVDPHLVSQELSTSTARMIASSILNIELGKPRRLQDVSQLSSLLETIYADTDGATILP